MAKKKQDRFVIKENQGLGAGMLYVVVDMQTGVNYLAVGGSRRRISRRCWTQTVTSSWTARRKIRSNEPVRCIQ